MYTKCFPKELKKIKVKMKGHLFLYHDSRALCKKKGGGCLKKISL